MKQVTVIILIGIFVTYACEETSTEINHSNLEELMVLNTYDESDEVIACAGSNSPGDSVFIYFYPDKGATDFQYFEASHSADGDNYANYNERKLNSRLLLNDYLYRFERSGANEGWGIVTFMLNGKLHASNPIRYKQSSKTTEYTNSTLTIDFIKPKSPGFSWENGTIDENEIFYEIVMDSAKNVLTATYTFDKNYTYYDTSNVVLNLTNPITPEELIVGKNYNIAIMGISIDNWINLFIEQQFVVPGP